MKNVAGMKNSPEMVSAVAGEVRENWRRRKKKKTRCVREVREKKKKKKKTGVLFSFYFS
jgi:anaerobic ribonucleoside-triphosphate reductase